MVVDIIVGYLILGFLTAVIIRVHFAERPLPLVGYIALIATWPLLWIVGIIVILSMIEI